MQLRAPTDQCTWHGDGAGRSHQSATSDIKVDPSFDVSCTHDIVGQACAVVPFFGGVWLSHKLGVGRGRIEMYYH